MFEGVNRADQIATRGENEGEVVDSVMGMKKSRHSRRTVPMKRSQKAFAGSTPTVRD